MEEKQQLEEQHRAVMDKYKYKRRQIRELQEDLQTMSHTLDNLCRDDEAYKEMIDEKQCKVMQVQTIFVSKENILEQFGRVLTQIESISSDSSSHEHVSENIFETLGLSFNSFQLAVEQRT